MAKAIKYFAEYAAENGEVNRVEIWVEGYVGAATEVICGGEPLLITRNKDVAETYLGGIVPTFYTFEFVSSSTFSASTFSSEAYGDVVIRHLRAGVLEFNAIVTPFVTSDADLPATYYTFTLQAECGIKYLANQKIDATLGNVRLIDILAEAMALIPRVDNFPFKVVDNTKIYTEAGPIADNAPLFDRLINKRTFAGLTYLQVIEQIIANRCEVVLDAGAWWIRNIAELSEQYTQPTRTTNLVNYSATGVKGSTVAYRPELVRRRTKGGAFGSLFSQKNIKITRQEPEKINFLPNNDFKGPVVSFVPSGWTLGPTSFSYTVDNTNGSFQFANSVSSPLFTTVDGAYLESSPVEWRTLYTLNVSNQTPETLKIRVRAELENTIAFIRMQILATISGGAQYLTSEGSWSSTPVIYTQRADAVGRTGEFEINVPAPPLPGFVTIGNFDQPIIFNLRVRLFRGERTIQGPGGLEQPGFVRFREVSVFKDSLLGDSFEELNSTLDFRGDPNAERGDVEEIETLIASRNGFPYRHGSLFTASGAEIIGFRSPFVLDITGADYANYLAQSFLAVSGKRLRTYEGTYFDTFNWSDILVIDNRAYRLHNFQESRKTRLIRVKLVELTFNSLLTLTIDAVNNEVDRIVRNIVQIGAIPQDFNFISGSSYDGRTVFSIRPDTRFDSTNVAELLLRANATAEDAGVSIKPGAADINLLTPEPLVSGVTETIATREWGNSVFQPLDADLTALAALSTTGVVRRTGAGAFATMAGTVNRVVKWGTNGALTDTIIRETGSSVIIGADTTIDTGESLIVDGTVGLRAEATSFTPTQIPVFIADPSGTARTLVTRTPAQLLGDIGISGTTNRLAKFTGDGSSLGDSMAYIDGGRVFSLESNFPSILLQGIHAEATPFRLDNFIEGVSNSGFGIFDVNANTYRLTISALGNVGLGVLNPATRFEIGTSANTVFRIRSGTGGAMYIAMPNNENSAMFAIGDANAIVGGGAGTRAMLWTNGVPIVVENAQLQVKNSLITPIIGNPAGVTANNTWTFTSNVNVPLLPIASAHAASKQYVDNLVATGIKEGIPVRTIALTNITLSGTQTISDVAVIAGDRVLVAGQSTPSQNGVYVVSAGSWSRATDSDTDLELRGFQYLILEGDFRNTKYRNTNESEITVGTTAITYVVSQGAELDPIFTSSPAFGITTQNILDWNSVFSAWGGLVPNDWWDIRLATKTTTDLVEGANLYFTNARALSAVQSALDGKQNLNSVLTALTGISGTGVVRWNGTAFTAGSIAISDVTNLSTSLTALEILKDRTTTGPIDGVREVRSIDYYQGRMDFGFDKTLDVPYLFYDTGDRILANYMDNDGVWFHVDQTGVQRRYLRQGDSVAPVPSLQAVTDVSRNSSNRILFNNVPYALTTDIPNLQAVSAAGASSSIRLQLNGVGYATLAEIGGGGGSVGSLAAVLGVGNNTNGIDINLNGLGVIRTGNVDGTPTVTIGNNANVDINSFNTIRLQSTNIRLNAGNLFGVNDFVDIGVTLDSTRFSKLLMGTIDGQDGKYITLRGNFIGIRGVEATGSPSAMFLDAKRIVIGSQTSGGIDVFRIAPNVITIGDAVGGSVLQPRFNFRPATFTNGQKYVFEYNSSTNTFNLVPA